MIDDGDVLELAAQAAMFCLHWRQPPVLPRLAGALGLPPYHSWSYSHMALPQAAPAPASIFITLSRRFIVFIIVNYCKFID